LASIFAPPSAITFTAAPHIFLSLSSLCEAGKACLCKLTGKRGDDSKKLLDFIPNLFSLQARIKIPTLGFYFGE
jgi:hypothetical protein